MSKPWIRGAALLAGVAALASPLAVRAAPESPPAVAPADSGDAQQQVDAITAKYDGVGGWLRSHGWTEQDAAALRAHLLDA